jgi:hypothetical protein
MNSSDLGRSNQSRIPVSIADCQVVRHCTTSKENEMEGIVGIGKIESWWSNQVGDDCFTPSLID